MIKINEKMSDNQIRHKHTKVFAIPIFFVRMAEQFFEFEVFYFFLLQMLCKRMGLSMSG